MYKLPFHFKLKIHDNVLEGWRQWRGGGSFQFYIQFFKFKEEGQGRQVKICILVVLCLSYLKYLNIIKQNFLFICVFPYEISVLLNI